MPRKKSKKPRRKPDSAKGKPQLEDMDLGLEINLAADLDQNVVLMKFSKSITWVGMPRSMALNLAESLREHAEKLPVTHGVDCNKEPHKGGGYLHSVAEDGPYDVDGVPYCGRCHLALDAIKINSNAN